MKVIFNAKIKNNKYSDIAMTIADVFKLSEIEDTGWEDIGGNYPSAKVSVIGNKIIWETCWSGFTYKISMIKFGEFRIEYNGALNGFLSQNLLPYFKVIDIVSISSSRVVDSALESIKWSMLEFNIFRDFLNGKHDKEYYHASPEKREEMGWYVFTPLEKDLLEEYLEIKGDGESLYTKGIEFAEHTADIKIDKLKAYSFRMGSMIIHGRKPMGNIGKTMYILNHKMDSLMKKEYKAIDFSKKGLYKVLDEKGWTLTIVGYNVSEIREMIFWEHYRYIDRMCLCTFCLYTDKYDKFTILQ